MNQAAATKPSGYMDACLAAGKVDGDWLIFSRDDYEALRCKYSPRGLGDRIARFAKPIARVLDAAFGSSIVNCKGCENRQAVLNKSFPESKG